MKEGTTCASVRHSRGCLAWTVNNKAKLITRRAYGFHSANAALALIHLTCGPITLTLPHEQTA